MVQTIYLEPRRVDDLVFFSQIDGENGIFLQKRLSGDFQVEKIGSPLFDDFLNMNKENVLLY